MEKDTTSGRTSSNIKGISFLLLALLIISLQNVAVRWIGGDYPVLEIVIFRNLVALPFTLLFFRREGGRGLPTTQQLKLEILRGIALFLSYTTYMMGLAALPLAEIEALRYSGPLLITILSVVILGEKVASSRWLAIVVGFAGVLLVVRPGSASFNLGSIFILISVLFYAITVIITRKLQTTDSSATMAYFSSLVYLVAALILVPLTSMAGQNAGAHPSIAFLFRAWSMPNVLDLAIMAGLGLIWAGWMYFLSRAYSLSEASVAAPFEYVSLLISVFWGFVLWGEVPTLTTISGAALTLLSGLYIFFRERK